MNKKKLKTEDGSEFTVFYLNTEPKNEAPPQTDHFHGVCGKAFEFDKDTSGKLDKAWKDKIMNQFPKESTLYDFDADSEKKVLDIHFPSFGLPFETVEKFMINDKIEKDEEKSPRSGCIYFYSKNMKMYEFLDEIMVQTGEDSFPMYELEDIGGVSFFVKAEDVKLYFTTPAEAADFINTKQS